MDVTVIYNQSAYGKFHPIAKPGDRIRITRITGTKATFKVGDVIEVLNFRFDYDTPDDVKMMPPNWYRRVCKFIEGNGWIFSSKFQAKRNEKKQGIWYSGRNYEWELVKKPIEHLNPILDDLSWRADLPVLFKEISDNSKIGIYAPILAIVGRLLGCVAKRAIELDDPILNICMLKLKLYDVDHYEIEKLVQQQKKRIQ